MSEKKPEIPASFENARTKTAGKAAAAPKPLSIRDALYEPPGPKTRKRTAIATGISLSALAVLILLVIRQFYITGQLAPKYWTFFARKTTWKFLGKGLLGTLEAAALAGVLAFVMGFLMMLGRISRRRILRAVGTGIVEFTRGVPTLLFIYFFFLVVPRSGIKLAAIWKIATPVAISAAGVVAEVLRSGVNAVPKGQTEAALSLGMQHGKIFRKIVFPQAFRYITPALIAELVIVVKDTTFSYVVNFPDLMQNAKVLISNYDALVQIYFVTAVVYILINYLLNRISVTVADRTGTTL
ncbi:MAG: amino acid ABC transporter permease [Blautia sp.]|nr:amino acid ABC transporter permease [Blautia sp.]